MMRFLQVSNDTEKTKYTYDSITGQIASETSPSGSIYYVYDPATGEHIETWTGTTQSSANDDTLYGYNNQGQLISVTTVREDGYAAPLVNGALPVTTYTYDPDGNLAMETLPNGVVTTYGYDVNNRLISEITIDASSNVLASYVYTLLSNGLIGTDTEQVVQPSPNSMAKDTVTYTYDADGHLTSESHDVGSNGADGNDWSQVYIYDLNGNRLETDKSIGGGVFIETAAFVYNAENQLTEQDGWVLGFEGPDVTKFTYDANGNLIEEDVNPGEDNKGSVPTNTTTYSYDLRGRQVEEYTPANVAAGTSAVTTYSAYDTAGNRVMEGSSYFLIDENNLTGYSQVLEERDGSFTAVLARSYVLGLDVVGQTIGNPTTANAVEYILSDGNHSTRQLVNSSGVIQSDWSYDSFGNITGGYNQAIYTGGGRGQPLTYLGPTSDVGFQGGYANPDGTINFRARNYDPVTGRFNNQDSMTFSPGDVANSNLYLFVGDDPRNGGDPSGHDGLEGLLTTMGMMATLFATYAIPVVEAASPYLAALTMITAFADPEAMQDFIASGGDPGALVSDILELPGLAANDAKSLLVFGRGLLQDANALGVAGEEVRALQGAVNNLSGSVFQQDVQTSLGLLQGNETIYPTTTSVGPVNVQPDLPVGKLFGVTDVKDVVKIVNTPQIKGFADLADQNKMPFSLVISPRVQSISGPVVSEINNAGGDVFQLDPNTNTWTTIQLPGKGPWKR